MIRFLILLIAVVVFACGGSATNESAAEQVSIDQVKKEVMAVHDEVMPKMGTLRKLEKQLRTSAESSEDSAGLTSKADDVKAANDAMMNWMRNYNSKFEGTEEEVRSYLDDQMVKITKVRDRMMKAEESAKQLLGQ